MAAKPTINWWEPGKRQNVDGSTLPSDTGVRLSSRHHLTPPSEYLVYRLLPKPLWKFWGAERQEVTRLDALEYRGSPKTLGSRYYSEPLWNLPMPPNEAGAATFRAWTDTEDASSGEIRSARIFLEEISESSRVGGSLGANVSIPSANIGPKVSADKDFQRHWRVRVVEDPWVEISVLQAEPVIDHLRLGCLFSIDMMCRFCRDSFGDVRSVCALRAYQASLIVMSAGRRPCGRSPGCVYGTVRKCRVRRVRGRFRDGGPESFTAGSGGARWRQG